MREATKRRLFTVTRRGQPIALVLARDFGDAVEIVAELPPKGTIVTTGAVPVRFSRADLRARRPTHAERWKFAVAASQMRGEVALAALPL